ncbi:alpha/beta fold hydrolase [Membranicola marinus]|uniref:Alpha/beta fold hydrolase n=1 Tax=Membranihabitans marinus TaxID=1227546 RepID=A0A953LA51_9BACT|nr:alpha/beta fold hydrolase [Membranihabitans marinus]MBY5959550.1 alpha/beta fold hydrolase [Membranihabitans marinus]
MRSIVILLAFALLTSLSVNAQDLINDAKKIEELPDMPFLPDPLVFMNQTGQQVDVDNELLWEAKRDRIKSQYQYWVSGSLPPAPDKIYPEVLSERRENGVLIRTVIIRFGPDRKAQITVELMIPPLEGKLPVFMTQWNHRGWAQVAVRRGYIGCVYAGADAKDDTKNYSDIFSEYDFATLMKRAWGSHRVVDYLYTLPQVDTDKIALTGHSRNGKQSLMAAAFDDRIAAVVSSSGGTGGESLFRFTDERFDTESVEEITRKFPYWFHPRLRLFSGREHKLPVDQNSLMALIAPRGLMLSSAITEHQGNPWAIEKAYKSVKKVYQLLDKEENIAINLRGGRHATAARDIEDFIDFFDYVFGRSHIAPSNKLFYDYSFEKWKTLSGVSLNVDDFPIVSDKDSKQIESALDRENRLKIQEQLKKLLGEEPAGVFNTSTLSWAHRKSEDDYLGDVIGEPKWEGMKKMLIRPYNSMGDYLWANLYLPSNVEIEHESVKGKYPLVVFLHEYSYPTGYRRRITPLLKKFTAQGFAVLAFDMIGFGTRIDEAGLFYNRYPNWSLMGKMVADTRNVINDAVERIEFVDSNQVYLCGYSLGGTVALFTAALDARVKGVAVASSFGSFRNTDPAIEGNKHYSHLHGLIPKLGFFESNEDRIPIDFDDVLKSIAPRPLYIESPALDRHHPRAHVEKMVRPVLKLYKDLGYDHNIEFRQSQTYDQFTGAMMDDMIQWMKELK